MPTPFPLRDRSDRCPGGLRPWRAGDGLLVRLRLIGGRVSSTALGSLVAVTEEFGDAHVYLTARANLEVRGLPGTEQLGTRGVEYVPSSASCVLARLGEGAHGALRARRIALRRRHVPGARRRLARIAVRPHAATGQLFAALDCLLLLQPTA